MKTIWDLQEKVDAACKRICGKAPTHIRECWVLRSKKCSLCKGLGKLFPQREGEIIEECPKCRGSGKTLASCKVRIIAVNALYHLERGQNEVVENYMWSLERIANGENSTNCVRR